MEHKAEDKNAHEVKAESASLKVSKKSLGIFAIVIVALVIVGVVAYMMTREDVAATVNGEVITMEELDNAYDSLPAEYQSAMTKAEVLEQLVQAKVIYQKAETEGFTIGDDEVNAQIAMIKLQAGMTDEQFAQALEAQGVTEEEFVAQYEKQLTVNNYLEERFVNNIEVTDEAIEKYYKDNPEVFKKKEAVVARHILIGDEGMSAEERRAKAETVLKELNEDNFCEKAKEYSTDSGTKETCGEIAFTRDDPLVEEFVDLSFKQPEGKMGLADTVFGTHIIWTVDKLPARTVPLAEAKPEIENFLKEQAAQTEFEGFYQSLSADSEITIEYIEA